MRFKQNNKGFTLVEVLVSLFLLALIIGVFSQLITVSYSGIYSAGDKSKIQYLSQKEIENTIQASLKGLGGTTYTTGNITVTPQNMTMNIIFPGVTCNVPGKKIITSYNDGKKQLELTSFVSNR